MKSHLLYFSFIFHLLSFVFLHAQWSTSPDSALQIGVGDRTEIISDGEGGAFVVWYSFQKVRVQKLDKYGYIQWTDITPQGGLDVGGSTSDSCWQITNTRHSALVADEDGGVYVMFDDVCCIANCQGAPQTVTQALIQHFDSLGNWQWGNGLPVSIRNSYETTTGTIVSDGAGGIIALYNERDSVGAPFTLRAQRFDAAGNRLWGNEGIIMKEPGGFRDVDSDGSEGVVINYKSPVNNASIVQRFDQNGQILWDSSGVTVPSGAFEIAVDEVGQAIYVHNSGGTLRINKLSLIDGSLQWDSLGVRVDSVSTNTWLDDFKLDSNGNLWITWFRNSQQIYYIQKIAPIGALLFPSPGIEPSLFPSNHSGVKFYPSIDSSMIAVWLDDRNAGNDFYGQRISGNGTYLWQNDVHISNVSSGISQLTGDGSGGIILTWKKAFSFLILAQQISRNGNLGEVLTAIAPLDNPQIPKQFTLFQNYPNPFNPATTIQFYLRTRTKVKLKVYDALGRQVQTLFSGKLSPGIHKVKWEGNDDNKQPVSSGIYYYHLQVNGQGKTGKMVLLH